MTELRTWTLRPKVDKLIDQSLDCVSRAPRTACKNLWECYCPSCRLTLAICLDPRRTWLPEGWLYGRDTAVQHPSLSRSRTKTRTPRRATWGCASSMVWNHRSFTADTLWYRRPISSIRLRRAMTSTQSTSRPVKRTTSVKPARATCPSTPRLPSCSSVWRSHTGKRWRAHEHTHTQTQTSLVANRCALEVLWWRVE